jgi:hypothetical protein
MSVLAAAALVLAGCLVLDTGRARERYVAPEYADRLARAVWILDSVEAQQELASPQIEADAAYILQLLIAQGNQRADAGAGTLALRVRIKERGLPSDLRARRTATVEIEAFASGDHPVAMALYSETTAHGARGVQSYTYLSGLLKRALRQMGRSTR